MHFRLIDLDPRSFWSWLPFLLKLFVLFLLFVTVFALYNLLRALWTTRRLQKAHDVDIQLIRATERRLANLGQLLLFVSYLFGFSFFFHMPAVFDVLGDYKTFPLGTIFTQLGAYSVFATDLFLLLLFLHSLRWAASAWFYRVSSRLT